MRILACLLALITLGGLAPPRALSQPYRLVCSYFDEPRAAVYWVDQSGSVTLDQNLVVGVDSQQITASPDGRSFFVAQDGTTSPAPSPDSIPWFFVDKEGIISRAEAGPWALTPSVFSPDGSLALVGTLPCKSYRISYGNRLIEDTGNSLPFPWEVGAHPANCCYSDVLHGVVWFAALEDFVYGCPTDNKGQFGTVTDRFYFGTKGSNGDMDISPDGRFVTVLGLEDPQLAVIGIQPGGTFYSVQNLLLPYSTIGNPYRVRYTPDGHFLLVVSTHYQHFLTCFLVDQETGALAQTDFANSLAPLGGYVLDALAITPDSRYAVIISDLLLNGAKETFVVYRINDDGTLTRITQERHDFPGYVSDMDFIPPYREPVTAASTGWLFYE